MIVRMARGLASLEFPSTSTMLRDSLLHHWCQQLAEQGEQAFPGSGHQTPPEEELRRLKRELEVTRQERDILKKALAIFSRTQP
jgi:transposase